MTRLRKQTTAILSLSVLLVTTIGEATAKPLGAAGMVNPILIRVLGTSAFPLPTRVPVGTTIRIGGSSSMETINQVLKRRFEEQFVGTDVVLNTQGTGPAIKDVLDGNADLAAIGRSLTEQEKAQGLFPVPVSRHKIAIIVGSQNPFKGDLTFEQFAKIFRGEIKDWSQVGGVRGPIRFIDRPDNSDTRQAFRNYPVFKQAPFVTGKTARQLAQDSTSQVIQALGTDGIGYAITDQLKGRGDVRVLSIHKTSPNNPKYPFSQPLIYVYKGPQPNPSAQAFLGFATAPASRQTIETARKESSAVMTANPELVSPRPTVSVPIPPVASPSATSTPSKATPTPSSAVTTPFVKMEPWWLWLLALPLLGGLFWWLLQSREAQFEPEELMSEPAYEEVPVEAAIAPIPEITAPLLENTQPTDHSRIILVPRSCRDADAYWDISDSAKDELKQQGAQKLVLRLYDVTSVDLQHQPPISLQEFDCDVDAQDRHLPIRTDDRDYLAELGCVAADGRWLSVARSEPVRVPACDSPPPTSVTAADGPDTATNMSTPPPACLDDARTNEGAAEAEGVVESRVIDERGASSAEALTSTIVAGDRSPLPPSTKESRIILVPRNSTDAYAYWEITDGAKESLRQQGGQKLAVRLYEVTGGANLDQPASPCQQFEVDELACDQHLPIAGNAPTPDDSHAYVVELGYITSDDRWLKLAGSAPVRVPSPEVLPPLATDTVSPANVAPQDLTQQASSMVLANGFGATAMSLQPDQVTNGLERDHALESTPPNNQSQVFLVPRSDQSAYVHWTVTQADKDALKHQGGQQLVLRVYDVMGTETASASSVQQFLCNEWERDQQVPIPVSNLDYVAELGYITLDGRFLRLALSPSVRVPGA